MGPTTRIYLVRHGETAWNHAQRIQGHTDIPLNDRGIWQAERLRLRMSGLHPDAVYTSDLCRSSKTAKVSMEAWAAASRVRCRRPSIIHHESLRERDFGKWEGLTEAEIRTEYPREYTQWTDRTPGFRPPGGESREELFQRISKFLQYLVERHAGETLLLFSHGGAVKTAISFALGAAPTHSLAVGFANASLSALSVCQGEWQVVFLNDTCHLEQEKDKTAKKQSRKEGSGVE